MKVITATMAKTIATQMADQPELSKMMNTLLLKALKGERQATFHCPAHIPVKVWESYQTFFAGLGYKIVENSGAGYFRAEW